MAPEVMRMMVLMMMMSMRMLMLRMLMLIPQDDDDDDDDVFVSQMPRRAPIQADCPSSVPAAGRCYGASQIQICLCPHAGGGEVWNHSSVAFVSLLVICARCHTAPSSPLQSVRHVLAYGQL